MGLPEKENPAAGGTARGAGASKRLRHHSVQAEAYHAGAEAVEHPLADRGSISLLDKWNYLDEAGRDSQLGLIDQVVLRHLLKCLNTRTLLCKPSIEWLCEAVARGRTVVTAAITRLKNAGWLIIRRRRGASEYAFPRMVGDEKSSSGVPARSTAKSREAGISREAPIRETEHLECRDSGTSDVRESGHLNTGRENGNLNQGESHSPTSLGEPVEPEDRGLQDANDQRFEEFWQAYPTPYGRAPTRHAYQLAIRQRGATHASLLAAARRYAFERQGEDSRFTKAPANWLNHDYWREEQSDRPAISVDRAAGKPSASARPGSFMSHLRRLAPAVAAMGARA